MHYDITLTSSYEPAALERFVESLISTTPFSLFALEPIGPRTWQLRVGPYKETLVIGFAKFAELQLLLARCGEVVELRRTDLHALAS